MRVLLDEQVPRGLASELVGHEVRTVAHMGWKGLENGELLRTAERRFDVVMTMDKRMPIDQDITQYQVGVILIRAASNRIEALRPLVPALLEAIAAVRAGEVRRIDA